MASIAYDSFKLEVMVYQKCNGDPDCMSRELYSLKNYSGVSGEITMGEDGSTKKPSTFKVVRNGEFVFWD